MDPHPRSRVFRLWAVNLTLIGALAGAVRQAGAQVTLESVVDKVKGVNPALRTLVVEQTVDVRVFLVFRWKIRTTLYAARPANYRIVVHNPPPWVARYGTVFSDISSPEKILSDYRATAIRRRDENHLLLELVAARTGTNPPAGNLVVETERWLVEELIGRYDWGDVRAVYQYEQVEDFFLPVRARVTISTLPVRADITFSEYRLNAPLPPELFQQSTEAK